MSKHNILGQEGEEKAKMFLINSKYRILELNWRFGHKEIDIIAETDDFLVIVEVKTRSSDSFDNITTVISKKKKRFLIESAEEYVNKNNITKETRFDLIFISNNKIEHVKEAFNAFDL